MLYRLFLTVLLLTPGSCSVDKRGSDQAPPPAASPELAPQPGAPIERPQLGAKPGRVVDRHGRLSVERGRVVDAAKRPLQLRGMSLFWSQWGSSFYNAKAVANTVGWGATVVRVAMGVEHGGYLSNPAAEKAKVKAVVDAAIEQGIYVIIDWHDHNATQHTAESVAFFSEMARLYANNPHVIFEIFNEPVNIGWGPIKAYSETVIQAIRATGARNLVIVGTPQWSQRVDLAANDPVRAENVAYALHFYAATHRQELRNTASYALGKGVALFVTEFGVCEASGNGRIDVEESNRWFRFLDEHQIGWANWSLTDKREAASALRPGVNPLGVWSDGDLTTSGVLVKARLSKGAWPTERGGRRLVW